MIRFMLIVSLILLACRTATAKTLDSGDITPSTVHLHFNQVPISQVLLEINTQTGMNLIWENSGKPEPIVSINADNLLFWDALVQLGKQCKFNPMNMLNGSLQLENSPNTMMRSWPGVACKSSGAFLITPVRIEHVHELIVAPQEQDFCRLSLRIQPEPRIAVVAYQASTTPTQSTDENAVSLTDPAPSMHDPRSGSPFPHFGPFPHITSITQDESKSVDIAVILQTSKSTGRRIATAKGVIHLWIAQTWQTIEIPDAVNAAASTHPVGGMALSIDKFSKRNNVYVVTFKYHRQQVTPDDWTTLSRLTVSARMNLLDPTGKPCMGGAMSTGGDDNSEILTHSFNPPNTPGAAGPFKLVVDVPLTIKQIDVPYDFSDLPMP